MINCEDFLKFLKSKRNFGLDYKIVKNLYPDGVVRAFIDDKTGKQLTVGDLIKYIENLPYKEVVNTTLLCESKSTGQKVFLKDLNECTDLYDTLIFKTYPYKKE
jgi:hypothetical protein